MNLDRSWVPMKWPCGPLEIARRTKAGTLRAGVKDVLEAWLQPSALEQLKGTPINCLVVPWASGGAEDAAQQQALRALLEAGRRLGISFVAKLELKEGAGTAMAAARAAGISAVMIPGPSPQSSDLPAILQFPRDKVDWNAATTIFSSTENVWPGLNLDTMKGDTAEAGPTGIPWVNSNDWFSLLAGALAPGKKLWLDCDPPDFSTLAHPARYGLAIADSCAYGSQWIISLDDHVRAGLEKGDPQAKGVWEKVSEALAFFNRHREWEAFKPESVLAVISDFRGEDASLSGEVLNLLSRRQVQFRIVERSGSSLTLGQGIKAILWLDGAAPSTEQHSQLLEFVRRGGLVIAAAYWGPVGVKPTQKDPSLHYQLYNVGQGQMAVAEAGFQDPYQVAIDAHLLVSRRRDLVRLYNPSGASCYASGDPVGRKRLVQVLNYSSQPAESVTVWVNERIESARLWTLGSRDARPVQGVAASPGTYFKLLPLPVYCALEYEDENR